MSEYDYSGLYNNGGPQNNNGQPAGTQPEQPQSEQSGYPNVGSSGVNTANTAQTDYSNYSSQQNSSYNPQGPVAGNGGNGGNGNNGGYNGYSYSSNPQPPQNEPKKSHGGKKVLLRVAACIGVVALGFGGGLAPTRILYPRAAPTAPTCRFRMLPRWYSPALWPSPPSRWSAPTPGLAAAMCRAVQAPA